MTMTGVARNGNQIALRTQALARIHAELFPPEPAKQQAKAKAAAAGLDGHAAARTLLPPLSDGELIAKARKAANGAKFSRLFDGDTTRYPSQNEADLALCSVLAFWCDCDASRMDALFRQSGLMRPKWDAKWGSGTYGSHTIDKAIAGATQTYQGAGAVRAEGNGPSGLAYVLASDVAAKPVDWTWEERIPKGMLTMFVGDAGQGKSLLLVELVAIVTNPRLPGMRGIERWLGKQFPDGAPLAKPGRVIMLCAEDSLETTIVPRLIAAGADLRRVVLLQGTILPDLEGENGEPRLTAFSLMRGLEHLKDLIRKFGDVSLVIIDPITSYLDKVDSNSVHEVRSALLSMQVMVAQTNIAFVMLSHFNKTGHKTLQGIMGSQAFGAVPRAVYKALADQTDEGVHYFLPDRKNNLVDVAEAAALVYGMQTVYVDSRDGTIVRTGRSSGVEPDPGYSPTEDEEPSAVPAEETKDDLEEPEDEEEALKARSRARGWIKTVRIAWGEPAAIPLAEAEEKAGITDHAERERPKQEAVEKLLQEEVEMALMAGQKFGGLSAQRIVEKLDWKTMGHPWRLLHKMVEKGLIQQKGTNRNARYAPKGFWKGVLRP
jgi:RecA-family ATPase